jgi:hypothetical protein
MQRWFSNFFDALYILLVMQYYVWVWLNSIDTVVCKLTLIPYLQLFSSVSEIYHFTDNCFPLAE